MQVVAEFDVEYAKRIVEDAMNLALKSIMLDTLFGETGVFRGRSFSTYACSSKKIVIYTYTHIVSV